MSIKKPQIPDPLTQTWQTYIDNILHMPKFDSLSHLTKTLDNYNPRVLNLRLATLVSALLKTTTIPVTALVAAERLVYTSTNGLSSILEEKYEEYIDELDEILFYKQLRSEPTDVFDDPTLPEVSKAYDVIRLLLVDLFIDIRNDHAEKTGASYGPGPMFLWEIVNAFVKSFSEKPAQNVTDKKEPISIQEMNRIRPISHPYPTIPGGWPVFPRHQPDQGNTWPFYSDPNLTITEPSKSLAGVISVDKHVLMMAGLSESRASNFDLLNKFRRGAVATDMSLMVIDDGSKLSMLQEYANEFVYNLVPNPRGQVSEHHSSAAPEAYNQLKSELSDLGFHKIFPKDSSESEDLDETSQSSVKPSDDDSTEQPSDDNQPEVDDNP